MPTYDHPDPNAPGHLCIHQLLALQAKRTPDAPAILAPGRSPLTYGQLHKHVDEVVRTLYAWGFRHHDRIAVVLPGGPEMAVAVLAVAAGATCVPLNPVYSVEEFDRYLAHLRVTALLTHAEMVSPALTVARSRALRIIGLSPTLVEAEAGLFTLIGDHQGHTTCHTRVSPDHVALVLHTTGTTSYPKIVPLTHTMVCTAAHNLRMAFGLVESDCGLNLMPLFHSHGLKGMLFPSLMAGASVVYPPNFSPSEFFAWLATFRPTWYTAVPAMHQAILAHAASHRDIIAGCPLRFIRSSSAALAPQVCKDLEQVFKAPVIESYGTTEASMVTCNPLPPHTRKPGSVGVPVGSEVAIMDQAGRFLPAGKTGEIVTRGPSVMQRYEGPVVANQHTFTDGWFKTGDQGYFDADGYLFITGRCDEVINRGGEKVVPQEVDDILMHHPAVSQAITFAVPHARLGEDIAAAVVLHQHATATDSDIRQFATIHLAAFKVPRQIIIVEDIPHSPTGKHTRAKLAETFGLTKPDRSQVGGQTGSGVPRTSIEEILGKCWAQVLDIDGVGIHDNFFELGGDSIHATQIISRIRDAFHVEISAYSFFTTPTVGGLARKIEAAQRTPQHIVTPRLTPATRTRRLPASVAQAKLYRLEQLLCDGAYFNISYALRLTGALNIAALRHSVNAIISRHEILRTTFATVGGKPVQCIAPTMPVPLMESSLQSLSQAKQETGIRRLARKQAQQPFNLHRGPLLRLHLVRMGLREHALLITMHHIISDGWSIGVLLHELVLLYKAFSVGSPSPLPSLPMQYGDFTYWQHAWRQSGAKEVQLAYWRQQLASPLPTLRLATDRPRTPVLSYRTACQSLILPQSLSAALSNTRQRENSTLFILLLAAFKMLLYGYTGQQDLVVGTLVANRNQQQIERLIGLFANTILLRTQLSGNPTLREVLRRVRDTTLVAYAHQDLPFEDLARMLEREQRIDRTSLCQVMFILQNAMRRPPKLPDVTLNFLEATEFLWEPEAMVTTFDLVFVVRERPQGLIASCIYKTPLFDAARIVRMLRDWQGVLEQITSQPEQLLSTVDFLRHGRA